MIKYHEAKAATRPTFRTVRYGNLLSDTYQGEVNCHRDSNEWSGWFYNLSNGKTEFRLGFGSRAAAARWVNQQLRNVGVD